MVLVPAHPFRGKNFVGESGSRNPMEATLAPPIPPLGRILAAFFIGDRFSHFWFYLKLLLHGWSFLTKFRESDEDVDAGDSIEVTLAPVGTG